MFYSPLPPTQAQIDFVEEVCYRLNITDFPSCSKEFTKKAYYNFIQTHIKKVEAQSNDGWDWNFDVWDWGLAGEEYF